MSKLNGVDLYYNTDHSAIAVLVSGGFGAGFSTWHDKRMAYDRRVVQFLMANHLDEDDLTNGQIEKFLYDIGYENVYLGGWWGLYIEWVPVGRLFRLTEYDGAESVELFDPTKGWDKVPEWDGKE